MFRFAAVISSHNERGLLLRTLLCSNYSSSLVKIPRTHRSLFFEAGHLSILSYIGCPRRFTNGLIDSTAEKPAYVRTTSMCSKLGERSRKVKLGTMPENSMHPPRNPPCLAVVGRFGQRYSDSHAFRLQDHIYFPHTCQGLAVWRAITEGHIITKPTLKQYTAFHAICLPYPSPCHALLRTDHQHTPLISPNHIHPVPVCCATFV